MTFAGHPFKQLLSVMPIIVKLFKFLSTLHLPLKIGVVLNAFECSYNLNVIEMLSIKIIISDYRTRGHLRLYNSSEN